MSIRGINLIPVGNVWVDLVQHDHIMSTYLREQHRSISRHISCIVYSFIMSQMFVCVDRESILPMDREYQNL